MKILFVCESLIIVNCMFPINAEFVVIHNGIITNYKDIKTFLQTKGFRFESDTDTEVIAKLIKYIYDSQGNKDISFRELVESVILQLVWS